MFSVLALIALGAAPVPQAADSLYLPRNLYLVRTTTVKVWNDPGDKALWGRMRVTEVVAGPLELVGREFEHKASCPQMVQGSRFPNKEHDDTCVPLLEADAQALWWVTYVGDDCKLHPMLEGEAVHDFGLFHFPYQKIKGDIVVLSYFVDDFPGQECVLKWEALWEEGNVFAKVVAEVYRAKSVEERRKLLEREARQQDSPRAVWAMALLSQGPKEAAVAFFRDVSRTCKLSALPRLYQWRCRADAQLYLDELLCRLDSRNWNNSEDRVKFLSRWFTRDADVLLRSDGSNRFSQSLRNSINAATFINIVKPFVDRNDLTEGEISVVNNLLCSALFDDNDRDIGINYLKDVEQKAPCKKFREAASKTLAQIDR